MKTLNHFLFVAGVCMFMLFSDATVSAIGQPPKIYIIDPLVVEADINIDGATSADRIFRMPDKGNPLALIADELKAKSYSEIHLFVLTKPGSMIFDKLNILAKNVDDYALLFAEWKKSLTPETKIIIHSEVLASVPEGEKIIESISDFTGTEVLVQK